MMASHVSSSASALFTFFPVASTDNRLAQQPLGTQEPKYGGYQLYTVVPEILVCSIPNDLSFQRAVVLPLAISTAAAGLYQKPHLGLPYQHWPLRRPVKDPCLGRRRLHRLYGNLASFSIWFDHRGRGGQPTPRLRQKA
jgi:hypothetical protein